MAEAASDNAIPRWEHFTHGADVGVRGVGASCAQAFEQAAVALMEAIADRATIGNTEVVDIECETPDIELLLVDWLNELIYEMATRKMLFARFEVQISDHHLQGRAWGERVDIERHHPVVEAKGATLTALQVRRAADGVWRAQCVVDV